MKEKDKPCKLEPYTSRMMVKSLNDYPTCSAYELLILGGQAGSESAGRLAGWITENPVTVIELLAAQLTTSEINDLSFTE